MSKDIELYFMDALGKFGELSLRDAHPVPRHNVCIKIAQAPFFLSLPSSPV